MRSRTGSGMCYSIGFPRSLIGTEEEPVAELSDPEAQSTSVRFVRAALTVNPRLPDSVTGRSPPQRNAERNIRLTCARASSRMRRETLAACTSDASSSVHATRQINIADVFAYVTLVKNAFRFRLIGAFSG